MGLVRRRSFLLGGVAGTAAVGCRAWTRPIDRPQVVSPHELETLAAMAETFLPGGDGSPREPAGVIARICPVCATKYDLNARFCGHDAGELVVIN